jgi:hypothetical protein
MPVEARGVRVFRLAAVLAGLLVGLRLALPGRVSGIAVLEIASAMVAFRLMADGVLVSAPSLLHRRSGRKPDRARARATAPPPADDMLAAASWGAVTAAPASPSSVHAARAAAHAAAGMRPDPAPAPEPELPDPELPDPELPDPESPEWDPLLAAASWGAPKPHPRSTRRLLPRRLRLPGVSRTRGQRVVHVAFLLAGVAIGLRWALPVADVSSHCPPQGEGQVMCTIQKAWLAALVQFAAPVVAAHVLAKLTLHTIPATIRRWRAGWRPARRAAAPPSEHFAVDPVLRAAAWGRTGEDDAPEQGRTPDRELVERVRSPRVVPVRSAPAARKRG